MFKRGSAILIWGSNNVLWGHKIMFGGKQICLNGGEQLYICVGEAKIFLGGAKCVSGKANLPGEARMLAVISLFSLSQETARGHSCSIGACFS